MSKLTFQKLKQHLDDAADILRGDIDASEFRQPIMTLMFLKRLNDQFIAKAQKLEKKYPKEITIMTQTSKMFENIAETRFGLCAGGLTTYEFARMNIPFAIICQNKHQLITAKEWEKRKIARNLGTINKNTSKKINGYLTSIIENKIKLTINKTYSINSESKTLVNEIRKLVNIKSIN